MELYFLVLENLVMSVESIRYRSEIRTISLNSYSSFTLPLPPHNFLCIDNLWFEPGMVVFLYGTVLRERGFELLCLG